MALSVGTDLPFYHRRMFHVELAVYRLEKGRETPLTDVQWVDTDRNCAKIGPQLIRGQFLVRYPGCNRDNPRPSDLDILEAQGRLARRKEAK